MELLVALTHPAFRGLGHADAKPRHNRRRLGPPGRANGLRGLRLVGKPIGAGACKAAAGRT
jgi:hypothetical protein